MKYKIIRPPLEARFHLPNKDDLFKVASGDFIKLMFQVGDDTVERMWVKLEECHDANEWTGTLDNQPFGDKNSSVLKLGKKIKFHPYDIIDIVNQGTHEMEELMELISSGIKKRTKRYWWERTPVQIVTLLGAVAGVIGLVFLLSPELLPGNSTTSDIPTIIADDSSQILDRSIFDLASELITGDLTSQERVETIEKTSGLETRKEVGTVEDIGTGGLTLLIKGKGNFFAVRCDFSRTWKQRLSLLKKDTEINFVGVVSKYDLSNEWIVLNDCTLIDI